MQHADRPLEHAPRRLLTRCPRTAQFNRKVLFSIASNPGQQFPTLYFSGIYRSPLHRNAIAIRSLSTSLGDVMPDRNVAPNPRYSIRSASTAEIWPLLIKFCRKNCARLADRSRLCEGSPTTLAKPKTHAFPNSSFSKYFPMYETDGSVDLPRPLGRPTPVNSSAGTMKS